MTRAIPDDIVEEVRARADLVEIVSEHTTLKRSGRTFRGPCPLHGGKGPNFSVDPGEGVLQVLRLRRGGDVYNFLMKHLGMSFPDAVRSVAERAGVEIPDERAKEPREEDPNRPLYEVASSPRPGSASGWSDEGARARAYLDGRGIGGGASERFGLGWAPESFEAFGTAARKAGYHTAEVLLAVGLVKESTRRGRSRTTPFAAG
jgi:DNA primase